MATSAPGRTGRSSRSGTVGKKRASSKKAAAKSGSSKSRSSRKPASKPSSRGARSSGSSRRKRLAVEYDIDGPRVRLGLLWFILAIAALVAGTIAVAVVYGLAAVAAAGQSARCWRTRKMQPNVVAATGFAGLMSLLAILGPAGAGLAVLGLPVGALILSGVGQRPVSEAFAEAAYTIQVSLFPGVAAASVVLLRDLSFGAAVGLVLIVSAYECGDFLVGTGAPNSFEGPIAGIAAVMVVTFTLAALEVSPFGFASAFAFGGTAAVLAPLGQLAASAILPRAGSRAPALRRLDSLLLAGPIWYVLIDLTLV